MIEIPNEYKRNIYRVLMVFLVVLSFYFAVKFFSEVKSYSMMDSVGASTVTLSGHGEVNAVPDIASVSFTITQESKTVKEAQALVAQIEKKSLDFLKENKVAEKDIKTTNASFNPKYDYKQIYCIAYPCPQKSPVIVGYEAFENITVKVRNTDDAGKIMQGLGGLGVTDLSGPNFSIDNEEGLKAEARKKAIDDAKAKASVLARDLGVRLGKITSFSETGNYPMMYTAKGMMVDSIASAPPPAQLPKGENTITSDVTITYEIQ